MQKGSGGMTVVFRKRTWHKHTLEKKGEVMCEQRTTFFVEFAVLVLMLPGQDDIVVYVKRFRTRFRGVSVKTFVVQILVLNGLERTNNAQI